MASLKENLLSLGHLTGTERNTFTKQREHSLKKSREMHLQQGWQKLRERELAAQQHNRQLLQQFEEAQNTLREMLSLTAAMKTIRMEYELYLDESSPRWQKELKEKTQAAQKKRMEEYLRSCLKNTEEQLTKSSADRPLLSQGPTSKPQNVAPPQKRCSQNSLLDYKQHGSPHLPYMQSSWQTNPQSQTARFPMRAPHQPQGSSHVPPSFLPPPIFPDPFQLHHLASTPAHHHPWPRQNPPGWVSSQPHYPWTAGATGIPSGSEALWGQLYMEEPPTESGVVQVVGKEAETSSAPSSKRERGGGSRSSLLSQELDIKPGVRLSSGHAESSESSMECSQASIEKRKRREKRGIARRISSDRERCSSQESSRISTVVVTAAVTVAQSSESDVSSVKGRTSTRRTRRSGGLSAGSPGDEKEVKGRIRSNGHDSGSHKEESQTGGEELGSPAEESRGRKAGDQSPDVKSERCNEESESQREEEESGSVSIEIENGDGDEIEKQASSSVGDEEEEEQEKDLEDVEGDDSEEKENNQTDDEQEERDMEDNEASEKKNTTEEEEETGAEEEMEESEGLKSDGSEKGKQGPASPQDEEVGVYAGEGGEDKTEDKSDEEEEGRGEEEEEQRRDEGGEPEEEKDSEDSIISPQDKSKMIHIIPEAASEDEEEEEESKTGFSDSDSDEISDEDDVEHLLAPQQQSQKKEVKDLRADEKPKAFCDKVEIFQVELDKSTKTDNPSDSDEFDHFYD